MYSKKHQIKINCCTEKSSDNIKPKNNLLNSLSTRNIASNNLKLFQNEENKNIDNSLHNEYFKDYYSKKNKNNFVSYYSKKKFKSIIINNGKAQLSNYIIKPEPFYSDLNSLDRVRTKVKYTIKNPKIDKNKNKNRKYNNSDYNTSKNTLNKDDFEEDIIYFNSNNNSNTIYTDFLNNTESNNLNMNINTINNFNIKMNKTNRSRGNIDLSRYQDHNFTNKKRPKGIDFLQQQTSSNGSKGVSFIMDYSKDDDKEYIYNGNESKFNLNKTNFNLNTSINRYCKSPFSSLHYNESIITHRKKNKTPKMKSNISKQIEYRRKKFENMREIEKKIRDYFLINGISMKNRELYHQSAIMIQSAFRAYVARMNLYKELNVFVGLELFFDLFNKIISTRNLQYYEIFFNNIKNSSKKKPNKNNLVFMRNEDYQYHIKNKSMILKKSTILKKNYIKPNNNNYKLKKELSNYFNIIDKVENKNENNNKYKEVNRNQNLILINQILSNEKMVLEEEIKKLKLENEKLQKDNDKYKSREIQFSESSSLPTNKLIQTDIHKNDENIENVSLELREIKLKKKKIDVLNLPILNLKKKISSDKKFWKNEKNEKLNSAKYKEIYLKYLILKKDIKIQEYKRKIFLKHKDIVKNNNYKINKFKNVLDIIIAKFKKIIYKQFFRINYKYMYIKEITNQKKLLYVSKAKIIKNKNNINKENRINNNNEDKKQMLKKIVNDKINREKNIVNKKFMEFYYKGLVNNNINEQNDNILEQRKKLRNIIMNNINKNKSNLKFLFYKFFYNGIISSIKKNSSNNNKKITEKSIYVKRCENKKNNKNNE